MQGWSGVSAGGAAGATAAYLVMPAADTAAGVAYEPCHALTCTHSGTGSDPQASPDRSAGCAAGLYAAGERITLVALPGDGQRVHAWSGADATPAALKAKLESEIARWKPTIEAAGQYAD